MKASIQWRDNKHKRLLPGTNIVSPGETSHHQYEFKNTGRPLSGVEVYSTDQDMSFKRPSRHERYQNPLKLGNIRKGSVTSFIVRFSPWKYRSEGPATAEIRETGSYQGKAV